MRPPIALTCQRHAPGTTFPLEPGLAIIAEYVDAIWRAGGLPVPLLPVDSPERDAEEVLNNVSGIVVIGGRDVHPFRYGQADHASVVLADPAQEAFELELILQSLRRRTPLLAICRGLQLLNVALGGTLIQHMPDRSEFGPHGIPNGGGGTTNDIHIDRGSLAERVFGTTEVRGQCHHHQCADRLGVGLLATGHTSDGCIEVVESTTHEGFVLGVQWHPEETALNDPDQQRLFNALVEHARQH